MATTERDIGTLVPGVGFSSGKSRVSTAINVDVIDILNPHASASEGSLERLDTNDGEQEPEEANEEGDVD